MGNPDDPGSRPGPNGQRTGVRGAGQAGAGRGGRAPTAAELRQRLGLSSLPGGSANGGGGASWQADSAAPARRAARRDWPAAGAAGYDGYDGGRVRTRPAGTGRGRRGDRRDTSGWAGEPGRGAPGRRGRKSGGGAPRGPSRGGRPPRTWSHWPWRISWWRHWSIKKVALLLGGLVLLLLLIGTGGFLAAYSTVPLPVQALSTPLQQSSVVYFSDGHSVVGSFSSVNRVVLSEQQIAAATRLTQAVIAAEDRNFETEGGISVPGLVRALLVDITGKGFQGGSTITEQLVKNYIDPAGTGNLTYKEKLKEIIIAIKLAKQKSKSWILTNYLNTIYLGGGAYGAQAAAETYFGRPAWKLDIAQAAMIAAMINEPSAFNPQPGTGYWHTALVARWHYVLANMVRDGAISQQAANAQRFPKVRPEGPDLSWTGYRGYIMYLVRNELVADGYSLSEIYGGGLKVRTTISKRLMNGLYSAVNQNKARMTAAGVRLPSYVHIGAVLEQPGTGAIRAFYGGPGYGIKNCNKLRCQLNTEIDPQPVGSSMKPYVLATAVSQGMNVQTSVTNSHSPLCIPPDWTLADRLMLSRQTPSCSNFGFWLFNEPTENTPGRNLSLVDATAVSNNPAFEDLIHRTGVQSVIDMAARLGVSPADVAGLNRQFGNRCRKANPNCTPGSVVAALGGQDYLTAVDQANTFATLVSGGTSATPHVISYVVRNGYRTIPRISITTSLTQAQAANVDYALSFDTRPGATGVNAAWNRPMIGKTGTIGLGSHASEAWFIGAVPQYSLSVTLFTDQPGTQILDGLPSVTNPPLYQTWQGSFGGAWPASIWQTFMTQQFSNLPVQPLPTPNFVGFTPWIQAKPPPAPPRHNKHCHVRPGPPQPGCPGGGPSGPPSPSHSPSPSPSSPSPTPSVTPSFPPLHVAAAYRRSASIRPRPARRPAGSGSPGGWPAALLAVLLVI